MTDTGTVQTEAAVKPSKRYKCDWVLLGKFLAGAFVACSELFLVLKGLVPATQYEALIVIPVLGVIGLHNARNSGASDATKAVAATQGTTPSPKT